MLPTHQKTIIALAAISLLAACEPKGSGYDISALSEPERQLFEQAAEKRRSGSNEEALNLYSRAAKLSTGAVEAHVAIAEILRGENKAAQSMPMLQDALNLKPNDARLHAERGFSLVAQAKYIDAIAAFDKATELDAEIPSAYSGKGVALDLQGKHSDAQTVYAGAMAQGLGSPSLENNYALSLIFLGKYDEAIALLEPHAATATATMRQNLALAYGLKGDVGKAMEYGEKNLDPVIAKKNLEFYKRYNALKQKEDVISAGTKKNNKAIDSTTSHQAVPVEHVESGNVGFVTGNSGSEVILKPNVDVIEVDPKEFEKLAE